MSISLYVVQYATYENFVLRSYDAEKDLLNVNLIPSDGY